MAGSEQEGLAGAERRPVRRRDLGAHADRAHRSRRCSPTVRAWVAALGAEAIAVTPELHDALVAVVSHVPQLAASTLMNVASAGDDEHAVLLRLAAGGFRDMTRIASSHPAIWPDICVANRDAIVGALDELPRRAHPRARDRRRRRPRRDLLDAAGVGPRRRAATCPPASRVEEPLVELRIPVPDREGVIAEVTTLAGALRRQHRRPRDRALARGPQRCARAGRRRARRSTRSRHALLEHGYHVAADAARHELGMSVPTDLVARRPAPAARAAAGARRQGHLAPRAAVRGDGRRPVARRSASPVATTSCRTRARARAARRRRSPSPGPAVTVDGRGRRRVHRAGGRPRLRQLGHDDPRC